MKVFMNVRSLPLLAIGFVLMFALSTGGILNWWYEGARFASPLLNYSAMLVILAIPLAQVALLAWSRSRLFQILGGLVVSPLVAISVLMCVPVAVLYVYILIHGHDPMFEHLQTLSLTRYQLSVYRTDGGATTPYGIAIRQENPIVPGVYMVRTVHRIHPAYDAFLTSEGDGRVRVRYSRDGAAMSATSKETMLQLDEGVHF